MDLSRSSLPLSFPSCHSARRCDRWHSRLPRDDVRAASVSDRHQLELREIVLNTMFVQHLKRYIFFVYYISINNGTFFYLKNKKMYCYWYWYNKHWMFRKSSWSFSKIYRISRCSDSTAPSCRSARIRCAWTFSWYVIFAITWRILACAHLYEIWGAFSLCCALYFTIQRVIPPTCRATATAIYNVFGSVFGDAPSPYVIGAVSKQFALSMIS